MKRIYLPELTVTLADNEHHYIKNVLRLGAGGRLEVLTPTELVLAEISAVDKRSTTLDIISSRPVNKPDYSFTAYQCILKREYMDNVVEKFTELGVTKIVPVISARSISEVKESAARRYNEIAKSAVLQSEREHLPEITAPVKISDIETHEGGNIIFYERGEPNVSTVKSKNMQIVIGPEGGFAEDEAEMLISKGFTPATPLPQILKAETAATVFAGWVMMGIQNVSR